MEDVKHLIKVLRSQTELYSEMRSLLSKEKDSILSWSLNDIALVNKRKEELLHSEKIQEEACKVLLGKIASLCGVNDITLSMVVKYTHDPVQKETLISIQEELLQLITDIHMENLSLKILYSSNNRMINDFFSALGMNDTGSYSKKERKISTYGSLA